LPLGGALGVGIVTVGWELLGTVENVGTAPALAGMGLCVFVPGAEAWELWGR